MPKQRLLGRLGIADGVLHLCPDRRVEPLRDLVAEGYIGIQRLAGGAGHARSQSRLGYSRLRRHVEYGDASEEG